MVILCPWASMGEAPGPPLHHWHLLGKHRPPLHSWAASFGEGSLHPLTLEWGSLGLLLTCSVWPGGSWSTLASDIFDCCYLANKLSRGGVYTFRTACVSKAGMGPYSSPSEQVLLGGPSHLGEPLQNLTAGGGPSRIALPLYRDTGEMCSGCYATRASPNGLRNETKCGFEERPLFRVPGKGRWETR